jgi:hypothetical protein
MSEAVKLKPCSKCKKVYPATLEFFGRRILRKSGLSSHCLTCMRLRARTKYHENREIILARGAEYRKKNRKKLAMRTAKWRQKNPEKAKELARQFRKNNSEWRRKYARQYYHKNKTRPEFILLKRLRYRLWEAVSNRPRVGGTLKLLGCDLSFFREYIETNFLPGMTWENRNLWDLDHVRPCAAFNLLNQEEQEACFHYTNIRPLWRKLNKKKAHSVGQEELYYGQQLH